MQIQDSASQLTTPLPAAATSASSATTDPTSGTEDLGNETTFLQLLVAQIQNQDPTAPMDSSTFLTQLAEFSQLEQLVGIRQDVQDLDPSATGTTTPTPTTDPTSGS
ncbi:MAG TPA: flagellar hook capping FlgD N-terminal domain-containing protein [Bryobacteraceae bacterium]|jgi:flagellar basal-body rod modification protein FlgD